MSEQKPELPLPQSVSRRWSAQAKLVVVIATMIAVVWALFRFSSLLSPLIIAVILAYLLTPLVNWLHRRARFPRVVALLVVYIILLGLISVVPLLVVPPLVKEFGNFRLDLESIIVNVISFLSRPISVLGFVLEPPNIYDQLVATLRGLLSPMAVSAVSILMGIASSLVWLIFILVVSFYLIKDADPIMHYLRGMIPPDLRPDADRLIAEIGDIWNSFFRGQLVLSATVGVITGVVVTALGLSNGAILGLLAGVLEVIPNFGPVLAAIPAILLALFQGSKFIPIGNGWFALVIAGAYVLIQQIENNYLVPRIIGRSVKLHPVVVLVGAVAGAYLGGILGVFLAAPVIASVRVLGRYLYRKVLDMEPFEPVLVPLREPEPMPIAGMLCGREINAILFDLDGTLMDTDDAMIDAWAERIKAANPAWSSPELRNALRRLVMAGEKPTNALLTFLDRLGLDRPAFRLKAQLDAIRKEGEVSFRPMEGAQDVIQSLSTRFKLGIITTRSRQEAQAFLRQAGLDGLFQVIITRDDVERLKPHPESVWRAALELGIPAQRCAVVGDTDVDIQAAKAAGALAIGVLSGFGDEKDLSQADVILNSIRDLDKWL
ncbi:MAG: AI-2E family transporter [Anaerolineae bacterium]|nr:AI-2E family transporter [Anaerolineae bacterium]